MNRARALLGSILIVIGVLYLLELVGVVEDAGALISDWWPLALLATAALMYLSNRRHWMTPTIIAVIAVIVLLNTTGTMETAASVLWPVLLIAAGLLVLVGRGSRRNTDDDRITAFAAFGGTEMASHSKHFEGGNIGALFGGADIDLRDARLAPNATLDVFTAFGGTDIKVPEGWKVVTHAMPLFGGVGNVTSRELLADDAPVLDVNATVLFGGVDVKH